LEAFTTAAVAVTQGAIIACCADRA